MAQVSPGLAISLHSVNLDIDKPTSAFPSQVFDFPRYFPLVPWS